MLIVFPGKLAILVELTQQVRRAAPHMETVRHLRTPESMCAWALYGLLSIRLRSTESWRGK